MGPAGERSSLPVCIHEFIQAVTPDECRVELMKLLRSADAHGPELSTVEGRCDIHATCGDSPSFCATVNRWF